jgi:hypothetical protein
MQKLPVSVATGASGQQLDHAIDRDWRAEPGFELLVAPLAFLHTAESQRVGNHNAVAALLAVFDVVACDCFAGAGRRLPGGAVDAHGSAAKRAQPQPGRSISPRVAKHSVHQS